MNYGEVNDTKEESTALVEETRWLTSMLITVPSEYPTSK